MTWTEEEGESERERKKFVTDKGSYVKRKSLTKKSLFYI